MKNKNCLNCIKKCKEKIDPGFCYCDKWKGSLTFNERAKLFKKAIQRAEKKYGLEICAGYINSWDDSENLLIQEVVNGEVKNEVYYETLENNYE